MNIKTGNGMGIKPTGMQLKTSNGMEIKTSKGMGIKTSKGLGLSSDQNYFKFNEYARQRRYFFGGRGKGRSQPNTHFFMNPMAPDPETARKEQEKKKKEAASRPQQRPETPEEEVQLESLPFFARMPPVYDRERGQRVVSLCGCHFCRRQYMPDRRW